MGIGPKISGGNDYYGGPIINRPVQKGNPVPTNFTILKMEQCGAYLAAVIQYPDCTNYEGKKILVFKTTIKTLSAATYVDPHFQEKNPLSPLARFEPTDKGWTWAVMMTKALNK